VLPVSLRELESDARARLRADVFDYYAGGAGDEITLRENGRAYDDVALRYRVLAGVGARDLSTTVVGVRLAAPILVAPMALQGLAHADGEVATARAAAARGSLMVVSTLASTTPEAVRAACDGPLWFQLYVLKDRGATRALVERVEAAGYGALVLTVDAPLLGRRARDERNAFGLPPRVPVAESAPQVPDTPGSPGGVSGTSPLAASFGAMLDPSLDWRTVEWLRSITRLPVLVKGVVRGDDAVLAAEHGAAGVIVSNHGGRQLDTAPATIRVLPEIADAVGGRLELLIDGGVRRGTDVVKAIALGARAVLVGRPILWGLALGGEAGVARVLELLRDELDLAMALCGCRTIGEIDRSLVM